jgi:hypothetical protein
MIKCSLSSRKWCFCICAQVFLALFLCLPSFGHLFDVFIFDVIERILLSSMAILHLDCEACSQDSM